jgi:hypothetical protein
LSRNSKATVCYRQDEVWLLSEGAPDFFGTGLVLLGSINILNQAVPKWNFDTTKA